MASATQTYEHFILAHSVTSLVGDEAEAEWYLADRVSPLESARPYPAMTYIIFWLWLWLWLELCCCGEFCFFFFAVTVTLAASFLQPCVCLCLSVAYFFAATVRHFFPLFTLIAVYNTRQQAEGQGKGSHMQNRQRKPPS